MPAAINELSFLNNYVDELHTKLRKAVREIERASARSIKAKIRVKRVEHLMREELALKEAQLQAGIFEVEESKDVVLSEAKAVIKHLSTMLSNTKYELAQQHKERRMYKRSLEEAKEDALRHQRSTGFKMLQSTLASWAKQVSLFIAHMSIYGNNH